MSVNFAVPGLMPIDSEKYELLPVFLHLSPHRVSDTLWGGLSSIGPITDNGGPMAYPAASARMEFTPVFDQEATPYTLSTEDETVLIEGDPAAWLFVVPPQPLVQDTGMWYWRFFVTDTNGTDKLIFEGDIFLKQ